MKQQELKEFIYFFNHNKSLNRFQRRKVENLLARDLVSLNGDIQYAEENKEVKKENREFSNDNKHRTGVNSKVVYTSPKNLQDFLREFNQDDVLKYTCHTIDSIEDLQNICDKSNVKEYDFHKHLLLINDRFKALTWQFKEEGIFLDKNMVTLMSVFLTGRDFEENDMTTWSSNDIKYNWSSDAIAKWALENPHIVPNPGRNIATKQNNSGYSIPKSFISRITRKRIKTFSDLTLFFKSQFHIRRDNSLRNILEIVNNDFSRNEFEISFNEKDFNVGVELLTDVDKLVQAYRKIVLICKECKPKEENNIQISLSFYDNAIDKSAYFCIHHINTLYNKTLKNAAERIGTKHSNLIEKQVNGLCDLYIEAEFSDHKCGRLNLWDSERRLHCIPTKEKVLGVKYILKF